MTGLKWDLKPSDFVFKTFNGQEKTRAPKTEAPTYVKKLTLSGVLKS